jgi:elongation factor Tu
MESGEAGDNVGVLLRGIERTTWARYVIAKPGSITLHTEFAAHIYARASKDEAAVTPFFKGIVPSSTGRRT